MRNVLFIFGCILVSVSSVKAGDAVDTRITFTIADDDILKGPEESTTASPSIPNFSPSRSNRLFYDDYERRDTGFENLTHFVLYGRDPGFFESVDTEAALVLRAEMLKDQTVSLRDDGSYIRIVRNISNHRVSLTAFPVSAHRMALGYSYNISWGGTGVFKAKSSPGFKLQWDTDNAYAFLGVKAASAQMKMSDGTIENDTVYGFLGGGGVDVLPVFRIEANGGYFYRGNIDKEELMLPDGKGRLKVARWDAVGGSAQLVYHVGIPIGIPIDFRLYRNDPLKREDFFRPEIYNDGVSFILQSEFSVLGQTLQDPEHPASTKIQRAMAGDITAKIKIEKFRIFILGVYRDLSYMLFNVPSSPPFVDFSLGIEPQAEYFGYVGFDYFFESAHITPGISFGIQRPAHIVTRVNAGNDPALSLGSQALVFRNETDTEILNPGDNVELIYAGKLTLRWDISSIIGAVGEFQVSYDQNRRLLKQDSTGIPIRVRADPEILGFTLMLQARF